jgi:hypothetical protein
MARYKLADGTLIDAPEDLSPEESAWLESQKAQPVSVLKDAGKSAVSGLVEGAVRAPFIAGDMLSLGARGVNAVRPGTFDPEYEKLVSDRAVEIGEDASGLQRHTPETTAGRYANAGGAALGGTLGGTLGFGPMAALRSASTGIPQAGWGGALKEALTKLLTKQAVTAPLVGMAAQGGTDLAGPTGGLATGLGAQLGMAALSRGLTPNHPEWLRKGTESLTKADWEQAFKNRKRLQDAGSTSYTLADALPETAQARGMTRNLSNTSGAAGLAQKLAGRNSPGSQELVNGRLVAQGQGDIPRLLDEASDALSPNAPNVGAITDQVARLAEGALKGARDARKAEYLPILQQGAPVTRQELAQVLSRIKSQAGGPENLGTVDQRAMEAALKAVNKAPLYPMPVTPAPGALQTLPPVGPPNQGANLVALSKIVKDLKRGVPEPGMGLDKAAGYGAYQLADDALKGVSQDYAKSMAAYGDATERLVNPLQQGLVGQLAGLKGQPPSVNSLPGVISRSPATESKQALDSLVQDPSLRGQIARIVADANKKPMREAGPAATGTARARQTVVDLADPQAGAAYSLKTGAADTLSRLSAEAGADATAMQNLSKSWVSSVLAPLYELRKARHLQMSEKETRVLVGLLANPTEANLKLWQKIAAERPDLQPGMSAMRRLAAVQGGVTAEGN